MSSRLSIEPAAERDLDELVPLVAQFYQESGYPFDGARMRPVLAGLLSEPSRGGVWILRDGTTPIGYFALTLGYSLEHGGRDAFIDELFVLPDYRGKGLARRALIALERAARRLDVHALHLEVERSNDGARALYEKLGFAGSERFLMTKRL